MFASANHKAKELYEFGPFRVDAERSILLCAGEPIALTPKAFQILLVLVRNSTDVVTKDDIMKTVWPDTVVEEGNLTRNIFMLRKALGERFQDHKYVVTVPGQGYRLAQTVHIVGDEELNAVAVPAAAVEVKSRRTRHWKWIAAAAILLVAVALGGLRFFLHRRPILTAKDTVVLADFANSTGDSVFDETLRQGTAVQLGQSPFLRLISEQRMQHMLRLMGRSAEVKLTPELAREICERTGSAAVVEGSIALLGNQYVLGLRAENCSNGDVLDEEQARAARKEDVLGALDKTVIRLRGKLGESLSSVQKFATPVEEATTPSLEALRAYSLGRKNFFEKGNTAALPFLQRAVELDTNFAIAYRALGAVYGNLNQPSRMEVNLRKAYELREKVSERERFYIEANYYWNGTGELEKAIPAYELWRQTYPRDYALYVHLGVIYATLGNLEKALEEARESVRLEPNVENNYQDLSNDYISLNRLEEAEGVLEQARERRFESEQLLALRYEVGFLKGDRSRMEQATAAAMGKPGMEDMLLAKQASTEAWYGRLKDARQSTRRAIESATRNNAPETAALYRAKAALIEVEAGNAKQAHADAYAATKLAPNSHVLALAALTLALAGDTAAAEKLAAELDRSFPVNTLVQRYRLPTIKAAVALQRQEPKRAIELLQVTSAIELGDDGLLLPAYLRGKAYLMLHEGNAAASEFQKFMDQRGLLRNFPWAALARLQSARGLHLSGEKTKAREAYQDFLGLWKDGDPDTPIFKQAKAEYAELP
jgi:DNA-binding winged helix-turn-helix (wHTH) protein/tetratricopeptide (TPR) repeat protein